MTNGWRCRTAAPGCLTTLQDPIICIRYGLPFVQYGGIELKKAVIAVLIQISLINAMGCGFADFMEAKIYDPHYSSSIDDAKYNEETLKEILECFDNKDSERLKAMFSKSVQQEYDLDSQIEKAFEIYGGESVTYESVFDWGASGATEYGEYVRKKVAAELRGIRTTNGDVYTIYFRKYIVYDEDPDELGVLSVYLCGETGTNLEVIGYGTIFNEQK